ncbi:hypothetical protein, partial [Pseudomonas syringae group genomosp. 7]|uniref:hypothetical protein n=1 Tax=Pseudomonas syringae group genomosp. 7 TaxID=251699 RepID=UPI00376FF076
CVCGGWLVVLLGWGFCVGWWVVGVLLGLWVLCCGCCGFCCGFLCLGLGVLFVVVWGVYFGVGLLVVGRWVFVAGGV